VEQLDDAEPADLLLLLAQLYHLRDRPLLHRDHLHFLHPAQVPRHCKTRADELVVAAGVRATAWYHRRRSILPGLNCFIRARMADWGRIHGGENKKLDLRGKTIRVLY
jgi:hypothetical protein